MIQRRGVAYNVSGVLALRKSGKGKLIQAKDRAFRLKYSLNVIIHYFTIKSAASRDLILNILYPA